MPNDLITTTRYNRLLDDLKDIIVQRIKNSRMEMLQGKWEIGDRIVEEFKKGEEPNYKPLILRLAPDLQTSASEIYRCVQFRHAFHTWKDALSRMPEGDNISWNKIKTLYLPEAPDHKLPRISPAVEIEDRWGIIDWWLTHENRNFTLHIKSNKSDIVLSVKPKK
jgi:hypothetical protein